jgi:prepilin-type N-terminal cleavage/methylation domain-containing protein
MGTRDMRLPLRFTAGFTLVELLIAMAITAIALGAIYGVYISSNRSYKTQDRVVTVQQNVRASADFMIRAIRMAGLDPLAPAADATDTNGGGIKEATATKIRFTADIDMDGTIENSNEERVTFEYDAANDWIRRCLYEGTGSESWNTLVDNISDMTLGYLDEEGNAIAAPVAAGDLDDIRTVTISITGQGVDAQGQTFTRTVNIRVTCRNLY